MSDDARHYEEETNPGRVSRSDVAKPGNEPKKCVGGDEERDALASLQLVKSGEVHESTSLCLRL